EPNDYCFLEANPAFIKQTRLENAMGRTMKELAPEHEPFWFEVYGEIARTGEPKRFEHYASQIAGGVWYEVYAFKIGKPEERKVAILFKDISERIRWERKLISTNELLQATFDNSLQIMQLFKSIRDEKNGDIVDFEWVMTNKRWNELYGAMVGKRLLTYNPAVIETGL
ncbi:hypothetical protein, partial [Niabella aquatica]